MDVGFNSDLLRRLSWAIGQGHRDASIERRYVLSKAVSLFQVTVYTIFASPMHTMYIIASGTDIYI